MVMMQGDVAALRPPAAAAAILVALIDGETDAALLGILIAPLIALVEK